MNIQIFGKSKCFDTKKAERYFKERRIKYQYIDIIKFGMSRGELSSVISAVGIDNLVDPKDMDYELFNRLAYREDKVERLFEVPEMIRTPVVRNGKQATIGYCPDVWKDWK
ncbi:MAG: ArsC family transcriptional regulator [Oscillospiraceae bacterium]|nr:ArsC family transcriptional regulator [Oscillospiraceae bacterium]